MYNPQKFKESDLDEAFELMDRYPFATVTTVFDGKPFISHLPLTPIKTSDGIELVGHLAKANPHWNLLSQGSTTIIFHGAHTYVTPKWYAENDVPTWNYSVVHASGKTTLIEDYDGLVECLKTLTVHAERHWTSGWDFFIPDDLKGADLSKHIVGFRMKLDDINFKRKLSQNRSPGDRDGVLRGLATRADEASRNVLVDMLKLYKGNDYREGQEIFPVGPLFWDATLKIAESLPQWFTKTGIENLRLDIQHQKGFVFQTFDNQVLGFITYFMNQGVAQIGWMGVHPEHHRQSIGFRLLQALEASLSSYGIKELLVSTLGDSVDYEPYARTRAFYRKNGFSDFKKILHPDNPECEEELILRKVL